jgi:hypothetical protein
MTQYAKIATTNYIPHLKDFQANPVSWKNNASYYVVLPEGVGSVGEFVTYVIDEHIYPGLIVDIVTTQPASPLQRAIFCNVVDLDNYKMSLPKGK